MGANNSVPVENNQDLINQKKIIMNQKKILEKQKQQINLLKKQKENNQVEIKQPEIKINQPEVKKYIEKPEINNDYYSSNSNNDDNIQFNKGDRFLEDVNIRKNDYKPRIENSQQELYQKFIKEQDKVKDFFNKKQKERKDDFYNELKQFGDKHNPYKILCLNDDADLEDIKKNYRLLSKKYHPDKGGDVRKFQLITKAYTYLLNEHESFTYREQTYEELQESLSNFINKQKLYQNKFIDKDNFSLNKFNEIFEKFKLEEENDGYGSIMNTNDRAREPETIHIAKNSMFDRNFSVDIFNKVFNNEKDSNEENKQLILYEEPQSIVSNLFNNASVLGNETIDDYTDKNYTDYKKAHSLHNNLINTNNIKYRQYRNIDELKNERNNIDTEMTEEEKEKYYKRKNLEKERENTRLRNIRDYDRRIENQFNTLNMMMIKDK
jgi:curved DNA-binding protein CbpA